MDNDRVLLANNMLTGEKGIQSNIEVANMCVQSNIPTDSFSLLYVLRNLY
jgi:hypothetical protein